MDDGLLKHQRPAKRQRPSFLKICYHSEGIGRFLDRIGDGISGFPRKLGFFLSRRGFWPRFACGAGLGLCILGVVYWVSLVIASSETSRGNLSSAPQDAVRYAGDLENTFPFSMLVPSSEEDDWIFQIASVPDEQTGSGAPVADRSQDIEYIIRSGETLSEIAYAYNISADLLAYYNAITNANRIRVGMVIRIPSLANMDTAEQDMLKQQPRRAAVPVRAVTQNIRIAYESRNNGEMNNSITVQFLVVDPPAEGLQSYEWDFGDGHRGFRANPSYEYSIPKTYVVRLTARDAAGVIYRSNPLYVDIPHPHSVVETSTTRFITLSSLDEYFEVHGVITQVARYGSVDAAPLDLSESSRFLTKARFTKPGFYGITVMEYNNREQYYSVFVSPIPSMHADAPQESFNWYLTQYNTGTTSNCGPTTVSMSIGWAQGRYFPVSLVRQAVGWQGDGATSFEQLIRVLRDQEVNASYQSLRSVDDIKAVIDSGSIAIALFKTDGVRSTRSDPAQDFFGKYYNDSVGHYIVIKGYSLNGEYFIVHDPIPSDWGSNSFRYGDEVSMIGRNRYYPTAEFLRSLRRPDMLVIPRN